MTYFYNNGSSYQTLNCHRSAISLVIGEHIGININLKRWFKGVFRFRPSLPKYNFTWDPSVILNYIQGWYPHETLSLKNLTMKCTILLALCTGQRVQTLSLIKINNINISVNNITIIITDIIKTSAPGRNQPMLTLSYFHEKPEICPARALISYLDITKELRFSQGYTLQELFITSKKPYKPATCQSISRWMKQVMSSSGIDTNIFSSHSTKHASTSCAHRQCLAVDTILRTAGWSSQSQTFARHYNPLIINYYIIRPIINNQDNCSFSTAICRTNQDP